MLATAATIQQAASSPQPDFLFNASKPLTLQLSNATILGSGYIDPRLECRVLPGTQDLSDKSVYMNAFKVIRQMALLPFTSYCNHEQSSHPSFPDVQISINPVSRLQVKEVMIGLAAVVNWQASNNFQSIEAILIYNVGIQPKTPDGPYIELGTLKVQRTPPRAAQPTTFNRRLTASNDDVARKSLTSLSRAAAGSRDARNTTATTASPSYVLKVQLDGPRLNKQGLFQAIIEAITEVASWPNRAEPLKHDAVLVGNIPGVGLSFRPWHMNPIAPPYLTYRAMVFMLGTLPNSMYHLNRFHAGSFIVEIDGQKAGLGMITRAGRPPVEEH
ncbi:MAG: hypothetical protein Q9209_007128 [Squamulea sp. 1 TL-2023]